MTIFRHRASDLPSKGLLTRITVLAKTFPPVKQPSDIIMPQLTVGTYCLAQYRGMQRTVLGNSTCLVVQSVAHIGTMKASLGGGSHWFVVDFPISQPKY